MKIILNRNYYYDNLLEDTLYLGETYPDILTVEEIGMSYDNRKIFMLKVGKGINNIICTGGVHGRESINPIVLMKMIESYCQIYTGENNVDMNGLWKKKIVDFLNLYSIYFIPLLNPDGYMIALQGFDVIRNQELRDYITTFGIPYAQWKLNGRGVDINRNFPSVTWRATSSVPNVNIYSGTSPGSELETQALVNLFQSVESIGYLDYHSRGKVIYYYRHNMTSEYNAIQKEIALDIAKLTGYTLGAPEEEFGPDNAGGNTVHYYSEYIEKPAITIETVSGSATFPLNINFQNETYYEIQKTPFVFAE